ncbi:MAG: hypothetical protein KDK54_16870 [Leptospiraceae bacterium]|nr:hypothetical protein [Leptospiraceae bacterium]
MNYLLTLRKKAKGEVAGSLPAAWAIAQTHIFIDLLAKNDFDFKLKKIRKIKY